MKERLLGKKFRYWYIGQLSVLISLIALTIIRILFNITNSESQTKTLVFLVISIVSLSFGYTLISNKESNLSNSSKLRKYLRLGNHYLQSFIQIFILDTLLLEINRILVTNLSGLANLWVILCIILSLIIFIPT